eukprot:scaffold11901_cov96-Isochrysis_galbana.AAC.8
MQLCTTLATSTTATWGWGGGKRSQAPRRPWNLVRKPWRSRRPSSASAHRFILHFPVSRSLPVALTVCLTPP